MVTTELQLLLFSGSTAHVPKYSLSRHGRWVKIIHVIIKLKSDCDGMYDLKWFSFDENGYIARNSSLQFPSLICVFFRTWLKFQYSYEKYIREI